MTDNAQHRPESRPGPLDGLVVLDFTLALAGPFATLLLTGLGARVIKIESPTGPHDPARGNAPFFGRDGIAMQARHSDDVSIAFLDRARGKESITLDLKHPGAREIVADLARVSDLAVQNWSAGVAERLGVDHASLVAHNPKIVVCSISGFGLDVRDGEAVTPRAMDSIIQAMSGLMMAAGSPGEPPVMSSVPSADLVTPLFALIGALAAVREADRTGRGQLVDVSMLGAVTALVATEPHGAYEQLGMQASRPGRSVARLAPFGTYVTSDGHVAVCAPTDQFAHALLTAIGADPADPRFADRNARVTHHVELDAEITRWSATRSTDQVVSTLNAAGVPSAPVRTPADAVRDPLVARRGEVAPLRAARHGEVPGVVGSGVPITFSDSDPVARTPAPELGEHTETVLADFLGYDRAKIAALHADGVI